MAFTDASFDDISGSIDSEGGSSSSGSFSSGGSTHSRASVQCSSDAWADTYSDFYDSYISAGMPPLTAAHENSWCCGLLTHFTTSSDI